MPSVSELEPLLRRYAKNHSVQHASAGLQICCPFHSDNSPSCTVFVPSGVFFCFVCHSEKGVGPRKGLHALGASKTEIDRLLGTRDKPKVESLENVDFGKLFAQIDQALSSEEDPAPIASDKTPKVRVKSRDPWPEAWGFRDVSYATMTDGRWMPQLIRLETLFDGNIWTPEKLPRLRVACAPEERGHELYLRLSTTVDKKRKSINSTNFMPILPFGLSSAKLSPSTRGLLIVEGAYDAMRTAQNIHDLGLSNQLEVMALLGTSQWGANWRKFFLTQLLPQFEARPDLKMIPFLDHDEAGLKLMQQMLSDLVTSGMWLHKSRVVPLLGLKEKSDPGDHTAEMFRELLVMGRLGLS